MKTKFIYVILAALLIGSQTISAQNKDNKTNKQRPTPEQMIQRQANQMVTTLMLDDATAAKFTPVYEKYLKDLSECRMMNRRERPRNNNAEATPATKPVLTDAEIEKQIKDQFAQSRKILDIREKYYNEFRKILSPKQIAKIYQTEKSNANKFRKEFDRRKGQKHGQGKRPSPSTTASAGPVVTRAHSWPAAASVAEMSLLNSRFVMWELPVASAAHSTARWAMLLLGGAVMVPEILRGDRVIVTSIDKPFRRLALSVIAYAMPPLP